MNSKLISRNKKLKKDNSNMKSKGFGAKENRSQIIKIKWERQLQSNIWGIKKIPYENKSSKKAIKIIKNQDSQKIQLHWVSKFVNIMWRFPYENMISKMQSRLLKIKIHRKYNYMRPQYLQSEYKDFQMKMEFQECNQDYLKSKFAENTITLGLNMCIRNVKICT